MSVNAPKDPISSGLPPIQPKQVDEHPLSTNPPPSTIRDSLSSAPLKEDLHPHRPLAEKNAPELMPPTMEEGISTASAFKIWNDAMRGFRGQLLASAKTNVEVRSKFNRYAAEQSLEFSNLMEKKQAALANLEEDVKKILSGLQEQLDKMDELSKQQQEAIDKLNSGNGIEKQQFDDLKRAYDQYVNQLKSLGATDLGNGNFSIPDKPKDVKDKCNQLTAQYGEAVAKFNNYWAGRSQQIQEFNEKTAAYNQSVAEYNQAMSDYVKDNGLEDFFKEKGVSLPVLGLASPRELIGYQEKLNAPSLIDKVPTSLSTFPLPDYVIRIAQAGPPAVPKVGDFIPLTVKNMKEELYQAKYGELIAFIEKEIIQCTVFWPFVRENIQVIDKELSDGQLLNSKAITRKLLGTSSSSKNSAGSLSMQAMEMGDSRLQTAVGRALLEEVLKNSKLSTIEDLSLQEKESQIARLTDKLLVLSVGSLTQLGIQAELPSLGPISDLLPSLAKDSPVFALLFAVSFLNRIAENIGLGTMDKATMDFIQAIPEYSALTPQEIAQLKASLNIGQLLVAAKLLFENIGIPESLPEILPLIAPGISQEVDLNTLIFQGETENNQAGIDLQERIEKRFLHLGASKENAQFLGEVASEIVQRGLLSPTSTSFSPSSIDRLILEKSITASLVMANYPLQDAKIIASKAINLTHFEGPHTSAEGFRTALESHLSDFGVKNSREVAMDAVLIAPKEQMIPKDKILTPEKIAPSGKTGTNEKIAPVEKQPRESRPAGTPLPSPKLTEPQLSDLMEKRIHQILAPQVGSPLAKQIGQEIVKSLFGTTPLQTPSLTAETPPSLAWSFLIRQEIAKLPLEEDKVLAKAIHETFKSSIQTMESFYAFSRKLMDPAYLFVYAYGIIYGNQGRKKGIDIPI